MYTFYRKNTNIHKLEHLWSSETETDPPTYTKEQLYLPGRRVQFSMFTLTLTLQEYVITFFWFLDMSSKWVSIMCDFSVTKQESLILLPIPPHEKGASHVRKIFPAKDPRAGSLWVSLPSLKVLFPWRPGLEKRWKITDWVHSGFLSCTNYTLHSICLLEWLNILLFILQRWASA